MDVLLKACPGFGPTWSEYLARDTTVERLPYVEIGEFVNYLIDAASRGETGCLSEVFGAVEMLLNDGDSDVKELMIVGLVEDIQNMSLHRGLNPDIFLPFLGSRARAGWFDLIRQWHGEKGKGWPGQVREQA